MEQGFGEFLRSQREARGWSLREAAERIGDLSYNRLGEIERARSYRTDAPTRPSRELVERLAKAYDLPAALLLAHAGYQHGEAAQLGPDEREILLYFQALPASRRRMAIAAMQVFALTGNDEQ